MDWKYQNNSQEQRTLLLDPFANPDPGQKSILLSGAGKADDAVWQVWDITIQPLRIAIVVQLQWAEPDDVTVENVWRGVVSPCYALQLGPYRARNPRQNLVIYRQTDDADPDPVRIYANLRTLGYRHGGITP